MENPLPEDIKFLYSTFLQAATEKGYAFAGMLMSAKPPTIAVISNVKEKGCALADLFRAYADIIDRAAADGNIRAVLPE